MFTDTPVATTVRTPRLRSSGSSSVPWNGVTPCQRVTTHSPSAGASAATGACWGDPGSNGRADFLRRREEQAVGRRSRAVGPARHQAMEHRHAPGARRGEHARDLRHGAVAAHRLGECDSVPPSPMMPS